MKLPNTFLPVVQNLFFQELIFRWHPGWRRGRLSNIRQGFRGCTFLQQAGAIAWCQPSWLKANIALPETLAGIKSAGKFLPGLQTGPFADWAVCSLGPGWS